MRRSCRVLSGSRPETPCFDFDRDAREDLVVREPLALQLAVPALDELLDGLVEAGHDFGHPSRLRRVSGAVRELVDAKTSSSAPSTHG